MEESCCEGALAIPQAITLAVLIECERVMGLEDSAREEFSRGEDPVAVFERYRRL